MLLVSCVYVLPWRDEGKAYQETVEALTKKNLKELGEKKIRRAGGDHC